MESIYSGKVREMYCIDNKSIMLVATDRISCFDAILLSLIPNKGQILTGISEFWFDYIKDIIPNHIISTNQNDFPNEFKGKEFEGRSMLVKKLKMLPVECVVRGYISGSGWESYKKNSTVCGIKLPNGLQESQKLPHPIFTPSTKEDIGDHDIPITFEQSCQIIGEELARKVRDKSIEIYTKCAEYALTRSIIIADTKFEFGLDDTGQLILGDEILTPDSSRFWPSDNYEIGRGQNSFDKQYVRDWLIENNNKGKSVEIPYDVIEQTRSLYTQAYEKITKKTFPYNITIF